MSFPVADSLYTFSFSKFSLSTEGKNLIVDSLSFQPNYSRDDFCKRSGYQDDRFIITVPETRIRRINYPKLITDRVFLAGNATISEFRVECYRDKRVSKLRPARRKSNCACKRPGAVDRAAAKMIVLALMCTPCLIAATRPQKH